MFELRRRLFAVIVVTVGMAGRASPGRAQERPWWELQDFESGIVCSLIHAANVDLVVLREGGRMMVASPPNNILSDIGVDANFDVFFDGAFAGTIAFAEDANGDRALFWLTITGKLVEVGDFDARPSNSGSSPSDLQGTGCDVCARYPALSGCSPDGDADDNAGSSPLATFCGVGSGVAATLSLALLFAGKGRRIWRGRARGADSAAPQV